MKKNIKVAVTGGIGSGKSTVCSFLKDKGYPMFSCDEIYSELLCDKMLPRLIADVFGEDVLNSDGYLDRRVLSEKVFSSAEALDKLNSITHPLIFKEIFARAENYSGLIFFEVPILFEDNYEKLFDEVVVVLRGESERINGVSLRDNLTPEQVLRRLKSQFNYDKGNFEKYYVIHNDGKINELCDVIENILSNITQKYKI